jgi:gliding motility-associatede transport system auxiliary component
LQRLKKPQASVACIVGDIRLTAPQRGDALDNGYARMVGALKAERFDVQRLDLTGAVPNDCGVLLLAAGRSDLTQGQADSLRDYLEQRNGAVILLVPPHEPTASTPAAATPVLEELAAAYGVRIRRDAVVVTPKRERAPSVRATVAPDMKQHPAGADLGRTLPVMRETSPLEIVQNATSTHGLTPQTLLVGAEYHWGETARAEGRLPTLDPESDVTPPFALAALADPGRDSNGRPRIGARLAVFGSVHSFDDEWTMQHPGNLHVLRSVVSWMAREDHVGNIQPRILATQPITLNPTTVRTTNIVFLAVLPACFMALGLCVAVLRRR